ncbi:MAG: hypothetical protein AAF725_00225 [Acidobacteriota bacterium]
MTLWIGVTAMLVWPLYPMLGASATPQILGLPLSLAWVIGALLLMFSSLLWLFLADEREARAEAKKAASVSEREPSRQAGG